MNAYSVIPVDTYRIFYPKNSYQYIFNTPNTYNKNFQKFTYLKNLCIFHLGIIFYEIAAYIRVKSTLDKVLA